MNIFKTYTDEVSPTGEVQRFGVPNKKETQGLRATSYHTIESDGFSAPGTPLKNGDPIIG